MIEITEKKIDSNLTGSIQEAKPYVPVSDDVKNADQEENLVADPWLLYDQTNQKESKEEAEIPELEMKNYRIDILLSQEEKLAWWWKEEESSAYINGVETKIKVLKKELAPGAYVWEYQNDGKIPSNLAGEQLFNWKAILALWLQNRLPTRGSISGLIKMQAQSPFDNFDVCYKNFKEKYFQTKCGYRRPDSKKFNGVGDNAEIWLANDQNENGMSVWFYNDYFNDHGGAWWPEMCLPLRLLKE